MANTLLTVPADSFPKFDELYVISDLHLGGPTNFQIFNSGDRLVALIDYLKDRADDKTVALVINGDFVDFLAEEPSKHFDPECAVEKLNRIAKEDPSFTEVFKALTRFAQTRNRRLIINLGNHDLELALPWARARLLQILSDGSDEACGRITLAFEGTGFPCKVGNATVLCVHGNEVDTWNVADYETIRRFGLEVIQGRPVDSWIPNAGSQLVIDVMNDLKRKYPFIDLLKPETQAAVPILLALAPDQHDKLRAIGATVRRLVWDKFKRATGFLGSKEEDLSGRTVAAADILSSREIYFSGIGISSFDRREYAATLLDAAEDQFQKGVNPISLLGEGEIGGQLGIGSAILSFFRGEDVSEVLRKALSNLDQDRSFDPKAEDTTFNLLDDVVGAGFDFLIAGHTHLARALERVKKSGWYFNSGTWARLIKLEKNVLDSPEEFKKVLEIFKEGKMQALDSAQNLVMRKLSVVVIRADANRTLGELREVSLSADDDVLPEDTTYQFIKE